MPFRFLPPTPGPCIRMRDISKNHYVESDNNISYLDFTLKTVILPLVSKLRSSEVLLLEIGIEDYYPSIINYMDALFSSKIMEDKVVLCFLQDRFINELLYGEMTFECSPFDYIIPPGGFFNYPSYSSRRELEKNNYIYSLKDLEVIKNKTCKSYFNMYYKSRDLIGRWSRKKRRWIV